MTVPRSFPRLVAAIAAAVLLAFCAVFAGALPATAHDQLLETDPADGAAVDALPAELTLTFSAELLSDGGGNEVQVTAADGSALTDGPAVVDGTTLIQPLLASEASGAVSVLWRVVSSDGHPISGEFSFTVAGAPAPTTSASTPSAAASTEPEASPEPTMTTLVTSDEEAGMPVWIWAVLGVVAVAILGAVVALLVARARGDRRGPDTGAER
ncbi:copper resistance protein CopC [Microbacterium sp. RD1]|uniref:copper resistance CopC family protein n=1 Tax=Microbacterium sp. RD1 TaxID=3457313 RepID=UPI003FA5B326